VGEAVIEGRAARLLEQWVSVRREKEVPSAALRVAGEFRLTRSGSATPQYWWRSEMVPDL
jgi:hypothetical protein